ncbi:MAG TPA: SRPBCC family protein [Actinomycetes bacterium]
MWAYEHTAETAASPEAVWRVLRDLDAWGNWDSSLEWVRLQGPFQVGSEVVMKPTGQDPVTSVIVEATENRVYADQTSLDGATLRFSHTLEPLGAGGTRVTHRLEITGPAADQIGPELGPAITEDFPEAMDALLARAAS